MGVNRIISCRIAQKPREHTTFIKKEIEIFPIAIGLLFRR